MIDDESSYYRQYADVRSPMMLRHNADSTRQFFQSSGGGRPTRNDSTNSSHYSRNSFMNSNQISLNNALLNRSQSFMDDNNQTTEKRNSVSGSMNSGYMQKSGYRKQSLRGGSASAVYPGDDDEFQGACIPFLYCVICGIFVWYFYVVILYNILYLFFLYFIVVYWYFSIAIAFPSNISLLFLYNFTVISMLCIFLLPSHNVTTTLFYHYTITLFDHHIISLFHHYFVTQIDHHQPLTSRSGVSINTANTANSGITTRSKGTILSTVKVKSFSGAGPAPRMIRRIAGVCVRVVLFMCVVAFVCLVVYINVYVCI